MDEPEPSMDGFHRRTLGEGCGCEEPFQRAISVKVDVDLVGAFSNWEQSSVLKMNEGVRNMLTVKIRLYLRWGSFVKRYLLHLHDLIDVNSGT
jgi:hypothetical protein